MKTTHDIVRLFQGVDTSGFPLLRILTDEFDVLIWLLVLGQERASMNSMTALQISDVLHEVYRLDITRQGAFARLKSAKGLVSVRRLSGQLVFTAMQPAIDRIHSNANGIMIVDPFRAFTALRSLESLLNGLQGKVLICDPYVDPKTLIHLASIPSSCSIILLTSTINDLGRFRKELQAYQKQYGNLELRVAATQDLHDRYLIEEQRRMWIFGHSLNGIGKKESFVIAMGQDVREEMTTRFSARWNAASVWK
jgi:hypothetical protein